MKIRPGRVEYFDVNGKTDGHDETNSSFSQFCECT